MILSLRWISAGSVRDPAPEIERHHPAADPHDRVHVVPGEQHRGPPVAEAAHHLRACTMTAQSFFPERQAASP